MCSWLLKHKYEQGIVNILLLTFTFVCTAFSANAESKKPNFLFILTDDQGYEYTGVSGNKILQTPSIDQLAERGTMFTQVFNQGSWSPAVCAPSRAMINTGRHLYQTGMNDNSVDYAARPNLPLWGETFRDAGYETFLTGKWHVSRKALLRSFSQGKAIFEGGMTYDHYNAAMVDLDGKTHKLSEPYPSKKHTSELIADAAVDFLQDELKDKETPFLMYVGFLAPHDARQSPNEYVEKYSSLDIPLPRSFMRQHSIDQGDFWVRDELLLGYPRKEKEVKQFISEYYAMVDHVDSQIGRVLTALEGSEFAENTIVIFTSDHGLAVGKHGLLGKQNQYDHSVRVPFIIAGKGIAKGKKATGNFYLNSLFPTTAELAGISIPKSVQAKSFAPLLNGNKGSLNEFIYGAYRHYQRMVRSDDFKLIYYPLIGATQLFDLRNDPNELHNLATSPKYYGQLAKMRGELNKLMVELKDPIDFSMPEESYKSAGYDVKPWGIL